MAKEKNRVVNAKVVNLDNEQAHQVQMGIQEVIHKVAPEAHGRVINVKLSNVLTNWFKRKELGSGD